MSHGCVGGYFGNDVVALAVLIIIIAILGSNFSYGKCGC